MGEQVNYIQISLLFLFYQFMVLEFLEKSVSLLKLLGLQDLLMPILLLTVVEVQVMH